MFSSAYNTDGQAKATEYRFPFADESCDLVIMKSVFTHMLPEEIRTYLRETSRVLKRLGRSVITHFLLNQESRSIARRGKAAHVFRYEWEGDPSCLVIDRGMAESGVAHNEDRIRVYYQEFGCSLLDIRLATGAVASLISAIKIGDRRQEPLTGGFWQL